jgi:hypothetical protein
MAEMSLQFIHKEVGDNEADGPNRVTLYTYMEKSQGTPLYRYYVPIKMFLKKRSGR